MFEVLECSWSDFLAEVDAAADLDALIAAHDTYLDTILKKSLLGERSQQLCKRLFTIFDTVLRFKGFADRLYEIVRDIQVRRAASDSAVSSHTGMRGAKAPFPRGRMLASWVSAHFEERSNGDQSHISEEATESTQRKKFLHRAFGKEFETS